LLVVLMVLGVTGCFQGPSQLPPAAVDSFGSAGRVTGKVGDDRTYIGATQWQHGGQLNCYIVSQVPGDDPLPAVLLLIRGIATDQSQSSGSQGEKDSKLFWRRQFTAIDGKKIDVAYQIAYSQAGADPSAELTLGGNSFDFDLGRIFLIDLTQNPVKPVQINAKLIPLLPSHDPSEEEFKTAVEKLRKSEERVNQFLDGK
jgi:hypothetical protein